MTKQPTHLTVLPIVSCSASSHPWQDWALELAKPLVTGVLYSYDQGATRYADYRHSTAST